MCIDKPPPSSCSSNSNDSAFSQEGRTLHSLCSLSRSEVVPSASSAACVHTCVSSQNVLFTRVESVKKHRGFNRIWIEHEYHINMLMKTLELSTVVTAQFMLK